MNRKEYPSFLPFPFYFNLCGAVDYLVNFCSQMIISGYVYEAFPR